MDLTMRGRERETRCSGRGAWLGGEPCMLTLEAWLGGELASRERQAVLAPWPGGVLALEPCLAARLCSRHGWVARKPGRWPPVDLPAGARGLGRSIRRCPVASLGVGEKLWKLGTTGRAASPWFRDLEIHRRALRSRVWQRVG